MKEVDIGSLKTLAQNYRALYVEDEPSVRDGVLRYLRNFFAQVDEATDGESGLSIYQQNEYDLVLTDIDMPRMNGLDMAAEIHKLNPEQEIIIVSAYAENDLFMKSIHIGVSGYILKPIDFRQMNKVLYKILYKLQLLQENRRYQNHLEEMVDQKTGEQRENYEQTITSLITMIEKRDAYTGGHSERVAHYSRLIAEQMGYGEEDCTLIYRTGILHDIGKIATPDAILLKPGKLSKLEYKLIQEHVVVGTAVLLGIPMYKDFATIMSAHHERYDGTGYPLQLKGDEIPPLARIMIVADAFDAMTTSRIYKARKTINEALQEIRSLSGKQFDPEVVESALVALADVQIAEGISQLPSTELEEERFAYFYKDNITALFNASYLDLVLARNVLEVKYHCINVLCLHGFEHFNKTYGWTEGDQLLKKIGDVLDKAFPDYLVFRVHGNNFSLLNEKPIPAKMINSLIEPVLNDTGLSFDFRALNIIEDEIGNLGVLEKIMMQRSRYE